VTQERSRVFAIDRGQGTEYVTWTAWPEFFPMVRGYGQTEADARSDLATYCAIQEPSAQWQS